MGRFEQDDFEDHELLAEIYLAADLMIAAGEATCRLDQASIDRVLGIDATV